MPIGLGGLVFFALWFWAVLDCIATDSILVRNLPKQTWIFIVVFIPTAGALAWLLLGRPEGAGMSVGGSYRPPDYTDRKDRTHRNERGPKVRGIEDSAEWRSATPSLPSGKNPEESDAAKQRRLLEWEAELEKREADLRRQGDDTSADD